VTLEFSPAPISRIPDPVVNVSISEISARISKRIDGSSQGHAKPVNAAPAPEIAGSEVNGHTFALTRGKNTWLSCELG
jgi:hypothetical protein